jgi:hypothetical protein
MVLFPLFRKDNVWSISGSCFFIFFSSNMLL